MCLLIGLEWTHAYAAGNSGNDYMVEGDDTVYIGGNQFYVKSDMSCTFRLKEETE